VSVCRLQLGCLQFVLSTDAGHLYPFSIVLVTELHSRVQGGTVTMMHSGGSTAWEPSITMINAKRIKAFMFCQSDIKRSFDRQFQKIFDCREK